MTVKIRFPALLFASIALLLADAGISAMFLCRSDKEKGLVFLTVTVFLAIVIIAAFVIYYRNSFRHFSKMNSHLERSAAEYMSSLPAPIAVIGSDGTFVWYNDIFTQKIVSGRDVYGIKISDCLSLNMDTITSGNSATCSINGSFYRIIAEKYNRDDTSLYIIFFHDETDYFNIKKISDETQQNVIILCIDNYEEILQNAKETDKARASVETEQLIENFLSGTGGVAKKISANTFFAVLENRHINNMIDQKFKILEDARNIKLGNNMPLTLSIGVGTGASNLAESEQFARECLDMALGRGGDQAVVKTENGYRFFGGVSKGVEKKSRAKIRIIANALQDTVMSCGKVYLMGHRFGDLDSVGSAVGLAGAFRLLEKEVFVVVDRKKCLCPQLIDMIKDSSGEDFFISPSEAVSGISDRDALIITDTHNRDIVESPELYKKAKTVVVIDHHRKTVNYIDNAVIFHHEPYASSACEMVSELIQYFHLGSARPDPCYADALLSGISLDTKNFVMRTGVRTFEAAAFLKKLGADTVRVKLLFSNSFDSYRRKTQIVSSAKIYNKCAIATADFRADDIRLVAPQAADELLGISDINAAFVIYRTGDIVNISGRSLGQINVQVIMEQLGGGGHQTMAAVQLKDTTVQDALTQLKYAIDEYES